MAKRIRQDFILRPEASGDERETGEGKAADQECPEGDRHLLAQTAHVEHILRVDFVIAGVQHAMLHAVNDRAGAKEEQRLEEGVCDQVEDRRDIRADAQRGDHEAKLRDGGVGQHALDVVLRHGNGRGEEGRERADERHHGHRRCRLAMFQPAEISGNMRMTSVHTRRHHRRRMDHGADRGRAFHRVRQPDVQRELRRFANRADEEQHADQALRRKDPGHAARNWSPSVCRTSSVKISRKVSVPVA